MADGRVALVVGGGGGIGAAICRALADAGHPLAVADLDAEAAGRVAEQVGGVAVVLDVACPDSVEAGVRRSEEALGPVDVLVSCAGWDEFLPFVETDEDFTARVIEINLVGPMRLARRVLPGMIERRRGRLIAIASDAGRVGSSLEAVYSGAKGGLIAFTKAVAREVARYGVTANCVCPGPTDTALFAKADPKLRAALERAVPMRRLGQPADVAPAVAFLASEGAGFITGQTLSVSGGLTMA